MGAGAQEAGGISTEQVLDPIGEDITNPNYNDDGHATPAVEARLRIRLAEELGLIQKIWDAQFLGGRIDNC